MSDQHVRIVMSAHGRGTVWVDGREITDIDGFSFEASAGPDALNRLVLRLIPAHVEIEGPAKVEPDA